MKKRLLIIFSIILSLLFIVPTNVNASSISKKGSVSYGSYSTGKYYIGT